jgi:hypothetical protein
LLKDFGEAYSSGTVQEFHPIPYSFATPNDAAKTNAQQRYKKLGGIYAFRTTKRNRKIYAQKFG